MNITKFAKRTLRPIYNRAPFKRQLFSAMRTCGIIPKMHQRLIVSGVIDIPVNGTRFKMQGAGSFESSLFWRGFGNGWERHSLRAWAQLCTFHDVIFDIGASTGVYSLVAKAVNPSAEVFAFEPLPVPLRYLRRNRDLNGFDFHIIDAAASNFDGSATIWDLEYEDFNYGINFAGTVNQNLHPDKPTTPVKVETQRLDSFAKLHNLPTLGLCKIDVESHEPEVIEGMGGLLDQRPTLLFEVWNTDKSGKDVGSMVESLLRGRGYLYFATDDADISFHLVSHIESHDAVKDYTNFLACTEEIAALLHLVQ